MENFLGDWRTCDMSLIWYAHLEETKHLKLSRRRLEKGKAVVSTILKILNLVCPAESVKYSLFKLITLVKIEKIIDKDFRQLLDQNSLSIGRWGYILRGTCILQNKK